MNNDKQSPLIVTAMPSEARHALEASTISSREPFGPWPLWSITIDGRAVYLLLSGIGMVNAGAALARALPELNSRPILNFGCAGAHRDDIVPGDVVVGDRYVHHRSVTVLPDGDERYVGMPIDPEDSSCFVSEIAADHALLGVASDTIAAWSPDPWPMVDETCIRQPMAFVGPIASGDSWTQSTSHIKRFHEQHATLCEDMEAAALAQIAAMYRVPFLAIKDISNNEFHSATDLGDAGPSLASVEAEVGRRAFDLTRRILRQLPD